MQSILSFRIVFGLRLILYLGMILAQELVNYNNLKLISIKHFKANNSDIFINYQVNSSEFHFKKLNCIIGDKNLSILG